MKRNDESVEPRPSAASLGCALAFSIAFPTLVTWIYFVVCADKPTHWQQMAAIIGKSIQFAFPIVWVWGIQQQKLTWPKATFAGLFQGVAFGAAVVVLMLIVYHTCLKPLGGFDVAGGEIQNKVQQMGISSATAYFGLGAFYAFVHSGLEEYYWRWFVFRQLKSLVSFRQAVLISSLGFMAHHVILLATYFGWASPLSYLGAISVAIGGAYWAWLYNSTGSLYACWASHMLVDAGIFLVGFDIVSF